MPHESDASAAHDAGREDVADTGVETGVALEGGALEGGMAPTTRTRQLGDFPRDIEEPDFHQYVEVPSGELALSFILTDRLACDRVDVQIGTQGPHSPIDVILERASSGGVAAVGRESAACSGTKYCATKLTRVHVARGRYTARFVNRDARPILAKIVIDTCHGLE